MSDHPKISTSTTDTWTIKNGPRDSSVLVFVETWTEDAPCGVKHGALLTIRSDGEAWTCCFGSMGGDVFTFLARTSAGYLARKMVPGGRWSELDMDKIAARLGEEYIDRESLCLHEGELEGAYGPDWAMDLPTKRTLEFEHAEGVAKHIISACKGRKREEERNAQD